MKGDLLKKINKKKFFFALGHKTKINLFYSFEYQIDFTENGDRESFDTYKYLRITQKLRSDKLIKFKSLIKPTPLSDKDLLLVHTKEYLDWIKKPLNLQEVLHTNYLTEFDEDIFNIFRYVAGGTYEGALLALENGKPSFNLSGGFHHSKPSVGEGFCPINDVGIAIRKLQKENKIKRALVIDLDYHQGNGTRNIFKDDEDVLTFSIHATQWCELEAKSAIDVLVDIDISNDDYIKVLKENLSQIKITFSADIVFYVAGSDTFIDDALCDMSLTMETLLKRDLIVCDYSKSLNVPIVTLPAGGYGDKSWQIYYNFIKYCLLYR